jgi:hypothetical protein
MLYLGGILYFLGEVVLGMVVLGMVVLGMVVLGMVVLGMAVLGMVVMRRRWWGRRCRIVKCLMLV